MGPVHAEAPVRQAFAMASAVARERRSALSSQPTLLLCIEYLCEYTNWNG